jgi:hypothetical protein
MDKKLPLTTAATAFAATLAAAPLAQAGDNPFALVEYQGSIRLAADQAEKGCGASGGEMKCGANMDAGKADAAKDEAQAKAADAQKTAPPAGK